MSAYRTTLDLDVLRTFVLGVELGSFAKAAERVARSPSAVSAQLKKLEDQAGATLFYKAGRQLGLTEAGEQLLGYARRLLALNDEAVAALQTGAIEGSVRLGLQEDFAEVLLPQVLGGFARAHPKLRVAAHVGRNPDLVERLTSGTLDLALLWDNGVSLPYTERLTELPMVWVGPREARVDGAAMQQPLRLVSFEAPCLFRSISMGALDAVGIPWWIAFTSPSLSGLWAATSAGLGIMVRTRLGLPSGVEVLAPKAAGLPELPTINLILCQAEPRPSRAVVELAALVRATVAAA